MIHVQGHDWQTFYEERAAIREYDGKLARPQAEAMAYLDCIKQWQEQYGRTKKEAGDDLAKWGVVPNVQKQVNNAPH